MKKNALYLFLLLLPMMQYAQKKVVAQNLPKYDRQKMHFGMMLGYNTMDFTIHNSGAFWTLDSIYSIENKRNPGFNINVVINYNIVPALSFRILPGLNFGQRDLEYEILSHDSVFSKVSMIIPSTFLDIPLQFKYKSERLYNMRAYVIAGGSYRWDLAAKTYIDPSEEPLVRLTHADYYYEVGAGVDFFLQYFKFGLEIKGSFGTRNVLIPDGSQYTRAIDRLTSKMMIISMTFEGSDMSNFWIFKRRPKH